MIKKALFSLILILLSASFSYAAVYENAEFLKDYGFSIIQDENFLIVKSALHNYRPLLIIEKLPSHLTISDEFQSNYFRQFAESNGGSSLDVFYDHDCIYAESVRTRKQKAYVIAFDANCDGLFDSIISPEYRNEDVLDRNIRAAIYRYLYRFDTANSCKVSTIFHRYSKRYSLMPLFKDAEFSIGKNINKHGVMTSYSDSLRNIHDRKFTVDKIFIKPNADGNLTIVLKDEKHFTTRREVKLQTNFKWE